MKTISLDLSVLALIVAAGSLAFSIYSDDKKMECEFRYKAYDRLNQLALVVHGDIEKNRNWLDQAKKANRNTSTELLNQYLIESVDNVTVASWKLQLHRLSLSEKVFTELNGKIAKIQDQYSLLDAARRGGLATEAELNKDMFSYLEKVDSFWGRMREVIDSSFTDTAMAIRHKCQ